MNSPLAESEAATLHHRSLREVGVRQPVVLVPVWWLLGLVVLVEALQEVFGVGSPDALFGLVVQAFVEVVAAMLCFARAVHEPRGRRAWLWIGTGMACWAIGSVIWDLRYSSELHPPYPTFSDALWLAWYPLVARGMALLVTERVKQFELHRWLDGLAVMLVVLAPAVALIVQPVAEHSADNGLATLVNFSYPILDVLMVGGILGVCGLLGWRPGRVWILIGLGCAVSALADGVFSVQQARGGVIGGNYDFLWSVGALLMAAAAWTSGSADETHEEIFGWRAIALPVAAQLFAAGVQVYAFFYAIARSERLVTLIVLVIATVQIVISRPRPPTPDES